MHTPTGKVPSPSKDGFASLFDSPLWSGPAQSLTSQDSFSFCPEGGGHDENAVPNVSPVEVCQQPVKTASTAASQATHSPTSSAPGVHTSWTDGLSKSRDPLQSSVQDNAALQSHRGCRQKAPWGSDVLLQPYAQPLHNLSADQDATDCEQVKRLALPCWLR